MDHTHKRLMLNVAHKAQSLVIVWQISRINSFQHTTGFNLNTHYNGIHGFNFFFFYQKQIYQTNKTNESHIIHSRLVIRPILWSNRWTVNPRVTGLLHSTFSLKKRWNAPIQIWTQHPLIRWNAPSFQKHSLRRFRRQLYPYTLMDDPDLFEIKMNEMHR